MDLSGLRTRVKICGVTRPVDAVAAARCGADAIGLNFVPRSPRALGVDAAAQIVSQLPPLVDSVAVFVDLAPERMREILVRTGIGVAQLHGDEPPEAVASLAPWRVLKAFRWQPAESDARIEAYLNGCRDFGRMPSGLMLDTYRPGIAGGTGETWNWSQAAGWAARLPLVLAGGLNPENVADAIRHVRPFAVDVASGVESSPGIKDAEKMRRFLEQVREADRTASGID